MNMHRRSYSRYMSLSRPLQRRRDSPPSPWYNDQIGKVAPISNSTQRTRRSDTPGSAQGTSSILPLNFSASASNTRRSRTSGIAARCGNRWRFWIPSEKFLAWLSIELAPGRADTFLIQFTPTLSGDHGHMSTFYMPGLRGSAQFYPLPAPLLCGRPAGTSSSRIYRTAQRSTFVRLCAATPLLAFQGGADQPVWLVRRHKNVVAILETEGREIEWNWMLVGHGKGDFLDFGTGHQYLLAHFIHRLLDGQTVVPGEYFQHERSDPLVGAIEFGPVALVVPAR